MSLAAPTEVDYRAWLAFLWTIFTFAIIAFAVWRGITQDIIGLIGTILTLDAVFINSYFKSKE